MVSPGPLGRRTHGPLWSRQRALERSRVVTESNPAVEDPAPVGARGTGALELSSSQCLHRPRGSAQAKKTGLFPGLFSRV